MNQLRQKIHSIIFEADTPEGKAFDLLLLLSIAGSVLTVLIDSVSEVRAVWGPHLYTIEWFFTLLFTVEYFLRLWSIREPRAYAFSFFGIVDLIAILPTYLSLFIPGAQALVVVRAIRVLRLFRILKMLEYIEGAQILLTALWNSRYKITVFAFSILIIVTIVGSIMYLIEGEENGFKNIPTSIYWAIVTITTVGYGDIAPQTIAGKILASFVMLLGYAIIAVPTGIVTAEIFQTALKKLSTSTQSCWRCGVENHADDALYCRRCGYSLKNHPE